MNSLGGKMNNMSSNLWMMFLCGDRDILVTHSSFRRVLKIQNHQGSPLRLMNS